MSSDIKDELQIKIEKAKNALPEDARNAIDAVDWKAVILSLRDKKGYDFEQLAELEAETELVLVGLTSPKDYPRELEASMRISKGEANDLVKEMNERVFRKIKEELIKNTERRKILSSRTSPPAPLLNKERVAEGPGEVGLSETREDILKVIEKPETVPTMHPIMAQKLSTTVTSESIKTEHTLRNLAKAGQETAAENPVSKPASPTYAKGEDPYRMKPE